MLKVYFFKVDWTVTSLGWEGEGGSQKGTLINPEPVKP